ncbi:hypothetical protein RT717_02415 [Imperialibacter roseus]|uniref:Uncharacterized protein n=1 Tax=Imperialibacter roseus TaxID=1324217 RepID=A0ABZ0IXL9_9BACT|nr:hypothetical protein [Imperialibacter roseus]WOK09797.1 hypothetical protein RT717_02415 [Imperialibacter roseus]
MKLFDYVFYRWFKLYAKSDNDPHLSASLIVTAYQVLTIINIVTFGCVAGGLEVPGNQYAYLLIIVFFVLNYLRYERNFDVRILEAYWCNEPAHRRKIRGWILYSYLAVMFLAPWTYGLATY